MMINWWMVWCGVGVERERRCTEEWCTSWWYQFRVLLQRGLKERRYDAFNRLRIFQVISVAFLGGLLWWHTPSSHIEDRVRISFLSLLSLNPLNIQIRTRDLNRDGEYNYRLPPHLSKPFSIFEYC